MSLRDRRVVIALVGGVVGVALVAVGLLSLSGGDGYDAEDLPAVKPLALTLPKHFDNVFAVSGNKAGLSARDRGRVVKLVEGYLRGATIRPLEEAAAAGDDAKQPAPASYIKKFFSAAAGKRLARNDIRALSDAHLPPAEYGVSTDYAKASLSALVDGGDAQVVAVHVDARMRVRTGELEGGKDAVVVRRVGDLVLEPGPGGDFRITSYRVTTRRSIGSTTTTTEAAFGETGL